MNHIYTYIHILLNNIYLDSKLNDIPIKSYYSGLSTAAPATGNSTQILYNITIYTRLTLHYTSLHDNRR